MAVKGLLYIEFLDHGSAIGWQEFKDASIKQASKANRCRAVGWWLFEDKDWLILANFKNGEGDECHNRVYIAKGAIKLRKQLANR